MEILCHFHHHRNHHHRHYNMADSHSFKKHFTKTILAYLTEHASPFSLFTLIACWKVAIVPPINFAWLPNTKNTAHGFTSIVTPTYCQLNSLDWEIAVQTNNAIECRSKRQYQEKHYLNSIVLNILNYIDWSVKCKILLQYQNFR